MKKFLLLFSICVFSISAIGAEKEIDAIYAWVEGTSTCYQLKSMPKVTYVENTAVLTLAGESEPELTVDLSNGGKLMVTVGVYDPSGVEETNAPVRQEGKYIRGGRLVIVKDGVKFDAVGNKL